MRRLAALALIVVLLVGIASPAYACGPACGVAIGLASFFALTALVAPFAYPYPAYAYPAPVVYQPPVVYSRSVVYQTPVYETPAPQAPVVHRAAAPVRVSVVQYPHGRYELRGDGVTTAYQWVWVVAPSSIPPPPAGLPPAAPPTGPAR